MDERMECPRHGPDLPPAFVCRHIVAGEGTGWFDAQTEELCPDAWCEACEGILLAAGEWTEEACEAAGITVLCACCYHRAKGERREVPELDAASFDAVLCSAVAVLRARNEGLTARLASLTGCAWHFDVDAGVLDFLSGGELRYRCRASTVGSFSERGGTWLAAWDNAHLPGRMRARSHAVLGYAARVELPALAEPKVRCTLEEAWGRAAVGAVLDGAVALYRCPSDGLHVFFSLLDVVDVSSGGS